MKFIIHPGAPRTGTTTIQKNLLGNAINSSIISKRAYSSSAKLDGNAFTRSDAQSILENINRRKQARALFSKEAMSAITKCTLGIAYERSDKEKIKAILKSLLNKILAVSTKNQILISSERLCDTSASMFCQSDLRKSENFYPLFALIDALRNHDSGCFISICMREPITLLRSRYTRTFLLRRGANERDLLPREYIQKQCLLESNHPGTSALTPAMHTEFIKQLQQHAFVKAFGFQELLASDDVFSLMGLQGEEKYAFRDFPRENKLPFTKEQEQAIEVEITQALKQYGFYDRIMKAQMFE